jgi:predicted enzyme related to lactoylglutathione lyase
MQMDFSGILIGSENPDRLVAYYAKLLGEPVWSQGGYTTWQVGTGGVTVGAHDEVTGPNAHPGRLIWNIETPDVRGEFARFKAAGATVIREPYSMEEGPEYWIATFADPDDNYFQLVSPMPSEPGG